MNLLLLDAAEVMDGEVTLAAGDRRARHIRDVLRPSPGQELRAGLVGGATGRATITALEDDRDQGGPVRLRVVLDGPPSPRPAVNLLLAVPRPKALSRVLQAAAAAGVARVNLVNAWRVDRSYFDSPRLAPAALAEDARIGCEQGGTTWVPTVEVHRLLMPFLAAAPADWATAAHRAIAHPRAVAAIESVVPPGARGRVVVAVGPEGGWIDRELASFADLGFAPVSLGAAVLRVESAVAALLAQIDLLRRLKI